MAFSSQPATSLPTVDGTKELADVVVESAMEKQGVVTVRVVGKGLGIVNLTVVKSSHVTARVLQQVQQIQQEG